MEIRKTAITAPRLVCFSYAFLCLLDLAGRLCWSGVLVQVVLKNHRGRQRVYFLLATLFAATTTFSFPPLPPLLLLLC